MSQPEIDPELRAALVEAERKARAASKDDKKLLPNYRLHFLYSREHGVYGNRPGNPWRKTRHRWIEENVQILDKAGELVPFKLNPAQRYLESVVLRFERGGRAVRVVILKARQEGMSTYIVALAFHLILTNENVRVRIVAHSESTANVQLQRAKLMLRKLTRANGQSWGLHLPRKGTGVLEVGEPIFGAIEITSSRAPDPGHGETNRMMHMTETSRWQNASEVAKGLEPTCHPVPGNYVFDETTARGNTGYFHDKFTNAWERHREGALFSGEGWHPIFLPWFIHEDYRFSVAQHRALTDEEEEEILATLDDDEKILLRQEYVRRGHGRSHVDLDQLAWRRWAIANIANHSLDTFHEQYPAFPEEAFLASGHNAFASEQIKHQILTYAKPPEFVGELLLVDGDARKPKLAPRADGDLSVWALPVGGKNYAIGVDTSAGTRASDPCCACVIEMETQEIVATLFGRWEPPAFGPLVAALGWYYNEAYLGIETHPSAHGLAVYGAAETAGYRRFYVERRADTRFNADSTRKGFSTSEGNKVVLINRIKSGLADEVPIFWLALLNELLNATLDDNGKIHRKCKNDRLIAYAIALKIRDVAYIEGLVEAPKAKPLDETARFWQEWQGEEPLPGDTEPDFGDLAKLYDGID